MMWPRGYVSHISHITSFALANTVLEKEKKVMPSLNWPAVVLKARSALQKVTGHVVPIFMQNKEMCWMF